MLKTTYIRSYYSEDNMADGLYSVTYETKKGFSIQKEITEAYKKLNDTETNSTGELVHDLGEVLTYLKKRKKVVCYSVVNSAIAFDCDYGIFD